MEPKHSSCVTEGDISQTVVIMMHSLTPLIPTILSLTQSIFMMTVSGLELEKYVCTSSSCDLSLSQYSELAVRILQVKFPVTVPLLINPRPEGYGS